MVYGKSLSWKESRFSFVVVLIFLGSCTACHCFRGRWFKFYDLVLKLKKKKERKNEIDFFSLNLLKTLVEKFKNKKHLLKSIIFKYSFKYITFQDK